MRCISSTERSGWSSLQRTRVFAVFHLNAAHHSTSILFDLWSVTIILKEKPTKNMPDQRQLDSPRLLLDAQKRHKIANQAISATIKCVCAAHRLALIWSESQLTNWNNYFMHSLSWTIIVGWAGVSRRVCVWEVWEFVLASNAVSWWAYFIWFRLQTSGSTLKAAIGRRR